MGSSDFITLGHMKGMSKHVRVLHLSGVLRNNRYRESFYNHVNKNLFFQEIIELIVANCEHNIINWRQDVIS